MHRLSTCHDARPLHREALTLPRVENETPATYRAVRATPIPLDPEALIVSQEEEILAHARDILTRRLFRELSIKADSPAVVRDYLITHYAALEHEVFGCLWLDNQHRLLAAEVLFTGTLNQTSVHPRELVKRALQLNAGAVVLFHNPPSGVATPSEADKRITLALVAALDLVGVCVLDHLIVAGVEAPLSFAETGLI